MSTEQETTPTTSVPQMRVDISTTDKITVPDGPRFSARVKWFDNEMNYGFATVQNGEHLGKDIFVHQSRILTLGERVYRSLRTGEYIEFALEETPGSEHKFQATAVTGPYACPLMCETSPMVPRHRSNKWVVTPRQDKYGGGGGSVGYMPEHVVRVNKTDESYGNSGHRVVNLNNERRRTSKPKMTRPPGTDKS